MSRGAFAVSAGLPLAVLACTAPTGGADIRILDRIEREITMPREAARLRDYSRYYALGKDGSIIGIYLIAGAPDPPGRRWVRNEDLPGIFDGGCNMVTVIADPGGDIRSVRCNGLA